MGWGRWGPPARSSLLPPPIPHKVKKKKCTGSHHQSVCCVRVRPLHPLLLLSFIWTFITFSGRQRKPADLQQRHHMAATVPPSRSLYPSTLPMQIID